MSADTHEVPRSSRLAGQMATPDIGDIVDLVRRGDASIPAIDADDSHLHPTFIVPDADGGTRVVTVDLEQFAPAPNRSTGVAQPQSVESFVAYVKRHADEGTTVWVEPDSGKMVAVLNDHAPGQAGGWGDHRAELVLPSTPQWDHWSRNDRVWLGQRAFAEHVQDGLDDLRRPSGAELLDAILTMQGTVNSKVESTARLSDGMFQFAYSEVPDVKFGRSGTAKIPEEMTILASPFYGEPRFEILLRVRYRVGGDGLQFCYQIDRPDVIRRYAIDRIRERLRLSLHEHKHLDPDRLAGDDPEQASWIADRDVPENAPRVPIYSGRPHGPMQSTQRTYRGDWA